MTGHLNHVAAASSPEYAQYDASDPAGAAPPCLPDYRAFLVEESADFHQVGGLRQRVGESSPNGWVNCYTGTDRENNVWQHPLHRKRKTVVSGDTFRLVNSDPDE